MLFKKIEQNIKEIIINKPKIILGLSGGPDSVFLFYFLKTLHEKSKIELIAAHLDHGWRANSKEDVKFCEILCKEHGITFLSGHADDHCSNLKFNGSKEELGRKLRRIFFEDALKKQNADFIALAHHLQDQQETFFWRIIRGSSLAGLSCMKIIESSYLRPILNISKKEVLDYLRKNQISYVQDQTNNSDKFLRNRIRKYVIPAISMCDTRFDQKFESSLKHLQEEDRFLKNLTAKSFKNVFTLEQNQIGNLEIFLSLDNVLQKRLIIYWFIKQKVNFNLSENYLNEILRFLKNQRGGSHQLLEHYKIYKKKNRFWMEKA